MAAMTDQQKQALWRELGQVFIWPWWDFDRAFSEIVIILEKYGFRR